MKTRDWSILEDDGVVEVAMRAASKVAHDYSGTIGADDAYQEATIILATKSEMFRDCAATLGLGVVHTRLWQDLVDSIKTEAGHRGEHISLERLVEVSE